METIEKKETEVVAKAVELSVQSDKLMKMRPQYQGYKKLSVRPNRSMEKNKSCKPMMATPAHPFDYIDLTKTK